MIKLALTIIGLILAVSITPAARQARVNRQMRQIRKHYVMDLDSAARYVNRFGPRDAQ